LAVAALSSLFALLSLTHGLAAPALLVATIVVAMHVFATALGTRLRDQSDENHAFPAFNSLAEASDRVASVRQQARSPWHARGTTALPWLRALVLTAIGIGAIVGSAYLAATVGYRTSPAGVVVGGFSVAVLCGWTAFLFGSFYGVFRHGFREAAADEQ
jgi:multisubunit Na+/H+ antiporter MnhC subunit